MKFYVKVMNEWRLFWVFTLHFAIFSGIFFGVMYLYESFLDHEPQIFNADLFPTRFILLLTIPALITGLITYFIYVSRTTSEFFFLLEQAVNKIYDSKSKQEVYSVYLNEYNKLRKVAWHRLHWKECRKLYTLMDEKYHKLPD